VLIIQTGYLVRVKYSNRLIIECKLFIQDN